jgi:methionyl-tRNA formyltransferase
VKEAALELGIEVLELNPKDPEFLKRLTELKVDAAAVVAYGKILTQSVLDAVPLGWYNLHFSLLPQWRGAAPAQRAIWNGDEVGGLTVFKITAGMDSGPILTQHRVRIEGRPTAGEFLDNLAGIGPDIFVKAFESLESGSATLSPQPDFADKDHAYAKKITVEDAHADFALPAEILDRHLRACNPDPGAWCDLYTDAAAASAQEGITMHLNDVLPVRAEDPALKSALELQGIVLAELTPGALIVSKKHVWAVCGRGLLELLNVTVQGKKPMRAADWARGARLGEGARLG